MTYCPAVRFEAPNLIHAMRLGQVRADASTHRKDNWGLRVTDDEESQIEDARRQTIGTLGEWAVANYFDLGYEFTVDTFKAPDVTVNGYGLQVKASEYGKNFIIRPDAKDFEPYIYCFVELPAEPMDPRQYPGRLSPQAVARVYLRGWMFPAEARERARRDPSLIRDPGGRKSPAIFIPVEEIHPIYLLRELVLTGQI